MFPSLVVWNETTHTKKTWSATACCIRGYHAAVGKLLVCEKELKNVAGGYCVTSFPGPARSSLAVRNSRRGPGLVHHVMSATVVFLCQHNVCRAVQES